MRFLTASSLRLVQSTSLALLGLVVATASAHADGQRDPAQAQALFNSALALEAKGDWEHACPQYEESMRLDPSVGAQINIGRCREHEGKLATAWAVWSRAVELNIDETGSVRSAQTATYLKEQLEKIEPRLPKLTLVLATQVPGLKVERDGVEIGSFDKALPVDPGEHVIRATADGYLPFSKTVRLEEAQSTTVRVELEADTHAHVEPTASASAAPSAPPSSSVTPPAAGPPRGQAQRVAGVVMMSAGGASLGVALVTGILAGVDHATLEGLVADGSCHVTSDGSKQLCSQAVTGEAKQASERGSALALVNTVTLSAGAGIAIAGLITFLTAPSSHKASVTTDAFLVAPLPGGAFVQLRGTY